jgi:hypothetical protein
MKKQPAFPRGTVWAAVFLALLLGSPVAPLAAEAGFVAGLASYPLRDSPQFSAPAAARLPVGTGLTILERKDGWVSVRAGEKSGWMPNSVVGGKAPAVVQLEPLQERARAAEARVGKLSRENDGFKERNEGLAERVATLEEELEEVRGLASGTRSSRRLQGMALGGGLVLFGWVTGYALASRSGQSRSKGRLIID